MSSSHHQLPLAALYKRALEAASKAANLPTIQDETQNLINSSRDDLLQVYRAVDGLGLFSTNETIDDLATGDLVYILVPYLLSEVISRTVAENVDARKKQIHQSERLLSEFIERLEEYEIVSDYDIQMARSPSKAGDFSSKREAKIKQFKQEKELKAKVAAAMRSWTGKLDVLDTGDDFLLFSKLLKSPSEKAPVDDDDDDDAIREAMFLLLRLYYGKAFNQRHSLEEEKELLKHSSSYERELGGPEPDVDDTWRLDSLSPSGSRSKGPLLDSGGRPLRPFTILPSTSTTDRARLRAEVFRPDHRLPTMTIDEYLEEERRRGNIIEGGGSNSGNESEQLALAAEMDGTVEGELKLEEKRKKEEDWAAWTDVHRKGEGNTMNRG